MSILDNKHILTINLDDRSIRTKSNIRFYNTDRNIAILYIKLEKANSEEVTIDLNETDLTGLKLKLTVIKPKTNEFREITGVLTKELQEYTCAIYKFELPLEFTDQAGIVYSQFDLSDGLENGENITIDPFSYEVKQSKLTGLNAEIIPSPDLPVLKQLIEEMKKAQQWITNIDDTKSSEVKTYSSKKIEDKFTSVSEQFNTKASKDEVVKLQNSFNDIVLQNDLSPNKDVELVAMRTNIDGNTFNTATLRIEDIEKKVKSLPIFTKLHHFNVKPTNSSSNFLMLVYDSSVINKFTDRTLLKDSILNIELEFKNKNFQDGGFVDFQIFQGATNGTDFETAKGYCYASPNLILNTNNVYSYSAKINANTTIYTNYYMKLFIRFNKYVADSNVEFTIKDISLGGISLMDLIKVNVSGATLNNYECELISNETQQIDTEQLKSEIMTDVDNRIATITPLACRWTGKRYASIGDSMTWQNGQTGLGSTNYTDDGTAMKGYQYYLNEKIGFSSFTNLGLSGQCLTMYDGETSASFMSRYTAYNYTNYDIITIMLGTNDYGRFGGLPIGTIDSTNIREFYGAYNTAISYMLTQNPKLKIILMTPFKRQGGENNNTAGFKLSDYAKAVKNIAEKWGLDCFDFYNRCGWNDKTFSTYTVDGLHFHQKGSDFSSPPFVNFVFNS